MTKDEIKQKYSMCEVVERYGLNPNRSGFIQCPFHEGDHDASMKIYKDSYYCFGCGASGDIFTFVQKMDNMTFKEAFFSLGGTYEKENFESRLSRYHARKKQDMREKEEAELRKKRQENLHLISIYREWVEKTEPMSQAWVDSYNALQIELYKHEILNGLR